MDDYGVQDSSNLTDTYASNAYSYNDDSRGNTGFEDDRSNGFSCFKENNSSPIRYQAHVEVDTHRTSNNDDITSTSNAHENNKSNDFSFSKENDTSTIPNQTHTEVGGSCHTANNDDIIRDEKESSNSDSEDLPSKNDSEKCMSEELENAEDSDLNKINFKVDQNSQIANEDTRSDRFMNINESVNDDNDCCLCKSNPLMCLAFFCDCFGL